MSSDVCTPGTGGYGSGWGAAPWGGIVPSFGVVSPPDGFDIYCFFVGCTPMSGILEASNVTVVNSAGFSIDAQTQGLQAASGGSAPNTDDAYLSISSTVPESWTLQVVVLIESLPVDFTDLAGQHLYVGTVDQGGAAAGVFISSVGLAYAPLVSLAGDNDLTLVGPFQVIPGTDGLFSNGVSYTIRLAVDLTTSTTYIFATPTDEVPFTGHRLIAILPAVLTRSVTSSIPDETVISVRGAATREVSAIFEQICLGTGLVMPNLPPRANAGRDQAIQACEVAVLDGSASFDPDGGSITYSWRLLDAPPGSSFSFEGNDGFSLPTTPPSGFSTKFYSAELGAESSLDSVVTGDVLLVGGLPYSIASTGVDGSGYYVEFATAVVPDDLVNASYKVLRQRALSNSDTSNPSFFPDVPGIYRFDLTVFDGQYVSEPSVTIVNVLASQVPRGCIPDLGFVWSYLSDFWNLVEDRERIQVFWEGLAQVTAAELLNLWQVDYSKSLRDIQRQFQRKWLHYDLRLAEPIPELTSLRQVRAGVLSSQIASSGVSGVFGTFARVVSPRHDPLTINFTLPDPYYAADIQQMLKAKLLGANPLYDVLLFSDNSDNEYVRITAPFPFTIDVGSNMPFLAASSTNGSAAGTQGQRLTSRVYKVDHSLLGVDAQANDVLVVSGEGYLISRIVDDPLDSEHYQRVVLQEDLPLNPGAVWSIPGHVTSKLLDFYNGQVSQGDVVVIELQDSSSGAVALVSTVACGACSDNVSRLAVDLDQLDVYVSQPANFAVALAYVVRKVRLPIGPLVQDIPYLQEFIQETDNSAVLVRNVDYFIEQSRGANSVRFVSGPASGGRDVWAGSVPPDRLWAETTYLDNSPSIEANFGVPADLTAEQLADIGTDADYLSAVRGLWYTLIGGPTMFNLRAGTQILLGLPFAEENGVITEIRTDFSPTQGRILVEDSATAAIVRSYSFPVSLTLDINPATGVPYVVGDSVAQFAPLVSGAEVVDYVKDPAWFQGILQQGVFFEVEKFHRFMVRVDSAAFNLSALLFVQNFTLRVKPTYTRPMFVVQADIGDTEVDVTDEVYMSGTLVLQDGACFPNFNAATSLDDYRAAGGGVRNKLDTTSDTTVAAPTFPVPTLPITWGLDKKYLCPEDEVSISYCVAHSSGVVTLDSGFKIDGYNTPSLHYSDVTITAVPAGPTGHTFPGSAVVAVTGNVITIRVVISGTLGPDAGDYEIVVNDGGSDLGAVPITVGPSGFIGVLTAALAVTAGDTVTVRIRPATGGARAPNWPYVAITLGQEPITFQLDTGAPAGTYCFTDLV